jgi:sugar-specific transcriptional regulator TrmB
MGKNKSPIINAFDQELSLNSTQFSALIDLFEAININEKGIEIIYDYLLKNKMIDDPKSIFERLGLSLKRVYKILSVLKEYGLIQVFDRPMKIVLNPPLKAWETIISNKIKQYREEINEKVRICEETYENMTKSYHITPDVPKLPPVEFISYTPHEDPIDFILNFISVEKTCLIAKGVKFENPLSQQLTNILKDPSHLKKFGLKNMDELIQGILFASQKKRFQVLLSEEYFEEILNKTQKIMNEFPEIGQILHDFQIHLSIKLIKKPFSNFIVKDERELMQLSIDPKNALVGLFVSRQTEIVQVFADKFNELCALAEDLQNRLTQQNHTITPLEKLAFVIF